MVATAGYVTAREVVDVMMRGVEGGEQAPGGYVAVASCNMQVNQEGTRDGGMAAAKKLFQPAVMRNEWRLRAICLCARRRARHVRV